MPVVALETRAREDYLHAQLDSKYTFNKRNVVNAMHYNVPQSRERCVFLLARKDQNIQWEFPLPAKRIMTMRDAIGNLPSLDPDVIDLPESERKKIFPEFEEKRIAGLLKRVSAGELNRQALSFILSCG